MNQDTSGQRHFRSVFWGGRRIIDLSVLVMQERRSKRLIRQFCLSKVTSPRMLSSPFCSLVYVVQARKYSMAGEIFYSLIASDIFQC